MSYKGSLRSTPSHDFDKREAFIFITISVLTSLYTLMKSIYMTMVLHDHIVALIFSYLQCVNSTAIVLLKVCTILFTTLIFRRLCVYLMAVHILTDIVVSAISFDEGVSQIAIPVYATFGSLMDLTIYSLFLRLKMEKPE